MILKKYCSIVSSHPCVENSALYCSVIPSAINTFLKSNS